ncbi:MAG: nucleotidyltransferase domain-containing protein [Campylobacterales bacterium]|nr:nucleotidyltransferase domain-containing protein [Campylobacterales bacterium]
MLSEKLKNEIINQLKPLNPEKIIVFGSFAYGSPDAESDLDICVVEKEYVSKWAEKAKIRELLKEIKLPKDILVPKLDEYNFYKNEYGSVYKDIEDKGIVLWSL